MFRILVPLAAVFLFVNPVHGDNTDSFKSLAIQEVNQKDKNKESTSVAKSDRLFEAKNETRYGVLALWQQSDWVARTALIILLIMSLGSWTIFLGKFFDQLKFKKECLKVEKLSKQGEVMSLIMNKLPQTCPLHGVYNSGNEAKLQTSALNDSIEPSHWVGDAIQNGINDVSGNLQNGLTFLATVGSTAPFVGLFGTVWAIYHALIKIGDSGQASLDKVAGPVGEALVMTAIGLAVAVPAVLGYNWLVRRNKILMNKVVKFGNILYVSFFVNRKIVKS